MSFAAPSPRRVAVAVLLLWSLPAALCPRSAAASDLPGVSGVQFLAPAPNSARNLAETAILLRPGAPVDPGFGLDGSAVVVTGSRSGDHPGRLRLARDGRTLSFRPDLPFASGETVTCRVGDGLESAGGERLGPFAFSFTIAGPEREALRGWRAPSEEEFAGAPQPALGAWAGAGAAAVSDSLPPDFPAVTASLFGPTAPGEVYLGTLWRGDLSRPAWLLALGNDGSPRFHRRLAGGSLDFKMQPDGRFTYFDETAGCFYALDSTYALVDSFRTGNGYVTDHHDIRLLPDGHALLMAYDPQPVDMSQVIPKGNPDAVVVGLVIQELDEEKEVVFQWRSWDHFAITDAYGIVLSGSMIDYVHGNSVEATPDGGILISSRHMDEVTKIDRATGAIVWRLGGRNNRFTFVGDPVGFSRQHDARILPNGHVTLFDNGNLHPTPYSRAVEYELDERKMTATLVWQYRSVPDVFSPAMGSVQRLPNGNTLIGWGYAGPAATEVTPGGRVVAELALPSGLIAYRAFRFESPRPLHATAALTPRTINLGSGGSIVAAIESDRFDVSTIDPASVRLLDTVPGEVVAVRGDVNANGEPDFDVRFDREALTDRIAPSATAVDVSGRLTTGEPFRAWADVTVVASTPTRGATVLARVVSPPGALPIVLAAGPEGGAAAPDARARTLRVFDVRGRLAARRRVAPDAAGRIVWDGADAGGRRLPAGVYFARIGEGTSGPAARIVLIR